MDFELLRRFNIIDYSLLLGIYKKGADLQLNGRHLLADDEGIMYSLSIIDIFQEYNYLKQVKRTKKLYSMLKKE